MFFRAFLVYHSLFVLKFWLINQCRERHFETMQVSQLPYLQAGGAWRGVSQNLPTNKDGTERVPDTQCMVYLHTFAWFYGVNVAKHTIHWAFGGNKHVDLGMTPTYGHLKVKPHRFWIPSLKLNSSPTNFDGWSTILCFWFPPIFGFYVCFSVTNMLIGSRLK